MSQRLRRYGPIVAAIIIFGMVVVAIVAIVITPPRRETSTCDGPNRIYKDRHGDIQAVIGNDPRCTGSEGTHS